MYCEKLIFISYKLEESVNPPSPTGGISLQGGGIFSLHHFENNTFTAPPFCKEICVKCAIKVVYSPPHAKKFKIDTFLSIVGISLQGDFTVRPIYILSMQPPVRGSPQR